MSAAKSFVGETLAAFIYMENDCWIRELLD